MSEDVYIEINLRPLEVNLSSLTPWDTLMTLTWWQWLLVLKGAFFLWVLMVTIVLPSIYMQVMLYTDEMTSRHTPTTTNLIREVRSLLSCALIVFSALQQMESRQNWTSIIQRYETGRRRRRKKRGRERKNEKPPFLRLL
ncbi:hypothetical protein Pcinc_011122 [Petrolisthes cinctipes]|uniref:Uncharacterized protein n=1 Tax=Petrolisthes cinctipes TaxID=88211 RepID=A0AAE1G3I5_PETCI|nr:hypothetical protein Pcinc_011122 [Petrolisthes cinctipes]